MAKKLLKIEGLNFIQSVLYNNLFNKRHITQYIMKIKRSTQDLIEQLKAQWKFLKKSCAEYDKGEENESKRIALSLRILLHDTKNSQSLFKQLNIKETVHFLDTAFPYNEKNLMSSSCLTCINSSFDGKTHSIRILPLLEQYQYTNSTKSFKSPNCINFSTWWNNIIIDDRIHTFSRKKLVLLVTDTDGGAHIDPKLPRDYHDLTRNNSMGWTINREGVTKSLKDFCLASIRQIGFEVDKTLENLRIDLWKY